LASLLLLQRRKHNKQQGDYPLMEETIGKALENIQIGKIVTHKNMTIASLTFSSTSGPDYLTLSQGFERDCLTVQEISDGGSVPELSVINNGDQFVILLDGEEICGAKQNRVLNTSILVAPKAKIIIPVSCTEQGRWNYTSKEFEDSGILMARSLRSSKQAAVTRNIRESRRYQSDQSEVWEDVASLHSDLGTSSGTGAMKDAYESKKEDLQGYVEAFSDISNVNGIAVFLDGVIVGIDALSYAPAMDNLLPKLVGSYAMDALRSKRSVNHKVPKNDDVRKFLSKAGRCSLEIHPSQGTGEDARLIGKDVQGAALIAEETVIHLALFASKDKTTYRGGMTSFSNRRNFKGPTS
jgi:hypothetical protein